MDNLVLIEIKLNKWQLALINKAAKIEGVSIDKFIFDATLNEAKLIIEEHGDDFRKIEERKNCPSVRVNLEDL